MKTTTKAIWRSLIIAAFGVAIGFLGELMPDDFKSKVESFSIQIFRLPYLTIWIIAVALIMLIFLFFIWKEAVHNNTPDDGSIGTSRKVVQKGKKSIYVEKNDGPININ